MKKIICVLLSLCFVLGMAACTQTVTFTPDTGTGGTQEPGQTEEQAGKPSSPSYDGDPVPLSATMFDNAYIELDDTESIGLILEEEEDPALVGSTVERSYLVRFSEDGTFEKITFVYTETGAYSDGTYEVTQEQIEPNPVNLYATDSFIFVSYAGYGADADAFENPEYAKIYQGRNENFVIDRATGKLYSLEELGQFYVHADGILRTDGIGLDTDSFYTLAVTDGALTVTDLMPNKEIYVYDACRDAFGNVYVYNETIARKEGKVIYTDSRILIGSDGHAYECRNSMFANLDGGLYSGDRYTIRRYGEDGALQASWSGAETYILFPDDYSNNIGYAALIGDTLYAINTDGSGERYRWFGTLISGEANTYKAEGYLPPMGDAYPLSGRIAVAEGYDGEIWYYDLCSEKIRNKISEDHVDSFSNQGLVLSGASLSRRGEELFASVEDVSGTSIYKLVQSTGANGMPVVRAELYTEITYDSTVLVIQPLN